MIYKSKLQNTIIPVVMTIGMIKKGTDNHASTFPGGISILELQKIILWEMHISPTKPSPS